MGNNDLKARTGRVSTLIALLASCLFALSSCSQTVIDQMLGVEGIDPPTPTDIEGLKAGIAEYEVEAKRTILVTERIGTYWRLLGAAYMDKAMYGEALKAYQEALEYFPAGAGILYNIGVAAGYMAKAAPAMGNGLMREDYLARAEAAFARCVEIDPSSGRGWYGLGILYSFELDRQEEAVAAAEKLLSIETGNADGMLLLGRALYMLGKLPEAAAAYGRVEATNAAPEKKNAATANTAAILEELNGSK